MHAMNLDDIRHYMYTLMDALAHTHNHGIIHRDVKPSNFLYDMKRRKGMLVDFGLAQVRPTCSSTCPISFLFIRERTSLIKKFENTQSWVKLYPHIHLFISNKTRQMVRKTNPKPILTQGRTLNLKWDTTLKTQGLCSFYTQILFVLIENGFLSDPNGKLLVLAHEAFGRLKFCSKSAGRQFSWIFGLPELYCYRYYANCFPFFMLPMIKTLWLKLHVFLAIRRWNALPHFMVGRLNSYPYSVTDFFLCNFRSSLALYRPICTQ